MHVCVQVMTHQSHLEGKNHTFDSFVVGALKTESRSCADYE